MIQIRGRVKLFNGQKELALEQIIPVLERDYDLSDFLPHTKYDVEKMYADLRAAVAGVKNPWLKRLLDDFVEDPAIVPRLKRAPAAMTMHHAFLGGLLEHIVSLIGLASGVSAHYAELDADLLLAGVILHDIGKIDELRYARGIDYSTEGRLLGHIMIGVCMVREKIKAIPGFPPQLGRSSGTLDRQPSRLARVWLALASSDAGSCGAALSGRYGFENGGHARDYGPCFRSRRATSVWTDRNPSLRRALLRTDKFLGSDSPEAANGSAATAAHRTRLHNRKRRERHFAKGFPGAFHG